MIKTNFTLLALLLPLAVWAEVKQTPNIAFVLFDDIGYGQPPSYRKNSSLKTPNLGRLARQGMRFTDASAAAAISSYRLGVVGEFN